MQKGKSYKSERPLITSGILLERIKTCRDENRGKVSNGLIAKTLDMHEKAVPNYFKRKSFRYEDLHKLARLWNVIPNYLSDESFIHKTHHEMWIATHTKSADINDFRSRESAVRKAFESWGYRIDIVYYRENISLEKIQSGWDIMRSKYTDDTKKRIKQWLNGRRTENKMRLNAIEKANSSATLEYKEKVPDCSVGYRITPPDKAGLHQETKFLHEDDYILFIDRAYEALSPIIDLLERSIPHTADPFLFGEPSLLIYKD